MFRFLSEKTLRANAAKSNTLRELLSRQDNSSGTVYTVLGEADMIEGFVISPDRRGFVITDLNPIADASDFEKERLKLKKKNCK